MFGKKITFTDLNGDTRTGTFYFHLTKTEMVKLSLKYKGGLVATLNKLLENQDENRVLLILDDIIMTAYGEKSEDGLHFEKSNGAKAAAFAETGAYDALFMELLQTPGAMSEFLNQIVPNDVADEMKRAAAAEAAKAPLSVLVNNSSPAVTSTSLVTTPVTEGQ